MNILALNPVGNSLKNRFDRVSTPSALRISFQGMKATRQLVVLAVVVLLNVQLSGQGTAGSARGASSDVPKNPWAFNLTTDGYIIPTETSYANPTFTADRHWLHLEARYNYENLRTGSLWAGYNFSVGKNLVAQRHADDRRCFRKNDRDRARLRGIANV